MERQVPYLSPFLSSLLFYGAIKNKVGGMAGRWSTPKLVRSLSNPWEESLREDPFNSTDFHVCVHVATDLLYRLTETQPCERLKALPLVCEDVQARTPEAAVESRYFLLLAMWSSASCTCTYECCFTFEAAVDSLKFGLRDRVCLDDQSTSIQVV